MFDPFEDFLRDTCAFATLVIFGSAVCLWANQLEGFWQ